MHKHGIEQKPEQHGSAESEPSLVRRVLMTPLYMLGMGLLLAFASLPLVIFAEAFLDPGTVPNFPGYGFLVGLAVGLGAGISPAVKRAAGMLTALIVLGGLLALCALVFFGALLLIGVGEDTVDRIAPWVASVAFLLPLALPVFVGTDELLERFRSKVRRTPSR
jgi:hypothetical protein